jgi:hypothetical protein
MRAARPVAWRLPSRAVLPFFISRPGRAPVNRDIAQWKLVRRKVLEAGVSRRQLPKETGSRRTIGKMLLHELPQPFKPRSPRYPRIDHHRATLDAFAALNKFTLIRRRVSISEICRYLQRDESYSGSYEAVRDYLKCRFRANSPLGRDVWEDLYESIVSTRRLRTSS